MERDAFDWGGLLVGWWVALGIRWKKAVRQQRESNAEVEGLLGAVSRQS